jgi:acid phosphatase (class A)
MHGLRRAAFLALLLAGALPAVGKVAPVSGYLAPVDYRTIVAPPPAPGSAAATADRAAFAKTTADIGSRRYTYATTQIAPRSPQVMQQLSCSVGHQLSPTTTPRTLALIKRIRADLDGPLNAAKSHFARDRPYVGADDPRTCDPRSTVKIMPRTPPKPNYSYPSGHAAIGALFGAVFAAAVPGRAATVRAWGSDLGDNRLVCRVHWQSDVAAGRKLGDAVYARLQADPGFARDLAAVRAELADAGLAFSC